MSTRGGGGSSALLSSTPCSAGAGASGAGARRQPGRTAKAPRRRGSRSPARPGPQAPARLSRGVARLATASDAPCDPRRVIGLVSVAGLNASWEEEGGAGAAKSSSCSSCTTAQSANDPNELRDARADCDTVARLSMSEYSAVVSSHDDTIVEAVPGFAGAGAPSTSSKSGARAGSGAGASANNGSQVPSRFRRRSFAAAARARDLRNLLDAAAACAAFRFSRSMRLETNGAASDRPFTVRALLSSLIRDRVRVLLSNCPVHWVGRYSGCHFHPERPAAASLTGGSNSLYGTTSTFFSGKMGGRKLCSLS